MTPGIAQKKLLVVLLLCALTAIAYWPLARSGFVDYDDTDYVTENLKIQDGLTASGVAWAFTTSHAANWHPVTWLSHMLDIQVYDLHPLGHHLTSLAFHVLNSALLFLLLSLMTGAFWRSAFVAALFALHPAHVESVAWVAERKDVLSTFFGLLAIWSYARYAMATPPASRKKLFYVLSLLLFALGLMSKPMLVTLPFVLLLLDFWPLGRIHTPPISSKTLAPLLIEKIPFLLLTVASSIVTFLVQHAGGATVSTAQLPLAARGANVLVSYIRYLGELFWPTNLAVFYPRPTEWPVWQIAGSASLLAVLTALALRAALSRRYLTVGWFWFLGTLVPVIGLVQVGDQSIADRYTYIPSIGIFIAGAWGAEEIARRHASFKVPFSAGAICVLAGFLFLTQRQAQVWTSTETLFRHAVEVTADNFMAEEALASALSNEGKLDEAGQHCLAALQIRPDFPEATTTYAVVLTRQGRATEALARLGELLRRNPQDASAHFALAQACAIAGDVPEAIKQYYAGLHLTPENADALNNLAWIRAANANPAFRDGREAVQLAQKACELTRYRRPIFIGTLAAAYAEAGRYQDAVNAAQKARDLFLAEGKQDSADQNAGLMALYQKGSAYHEPPSTNSIAPPPP